MNLANLTFAPQVPAANRPVPTAGRRSGFTLVELLVSMALILFIMGILSQAFVTAVEVFRNLKGLGDLQENLRAGANQFRFDLSQDHFEGKRRTSDPTFTSVPPREGFLRIYQGAGSTLEGNDGDNMPSYRATNHILHFASRLKGNQQQSFYTAQIGAASTALFFSKATFFNLPPPGADDATLNSQPFYRSQWAEIAYYLVQTGTTEELYNPGGAGQPLYGLYRVQFVAVTDSSQLNGQFANGSITDFMGVACTQTANGLVFYTPNDFATGPGGRTLNLGGALPANATASLVVPNVVSFQVQAIGGSNIAAPQDLSAFGVGGPPYSYDSSSAPFVLNGVSITIRVWDNTSRQTRQLTIVQDL
jgi:prepilin-type N-terminal cleavage/methylation domain-containing protein